MRRLLIFTMVVIYSALQPPSLALAAEGGPDSLDARLSELITHPYRHGVPYDVVMSFGERAVPLLKQHLEEPSLAQFRAQMLIMIGYLGGPGETPLLRHYIMDRFEGEIAESDLRAVMAALEALGFISDRDTAALAFLKSATNPVLFSKVHFTSSIRGPERLRLLLSKIAINGIGMSGRQEAEAILLELQRHPYSPDQLGNVSYALESHGRLMKVGRSAFYRASKAPGGDTRRIEP